MKPCVVRHLVFGEGSPRVCMPLCAESAQGVEAEARLCLSAGGGDLVEWRLDYFEHAERFDEVAATLVKLRAVIGDMPILLTWRSVREGGQADIDDNSLVMLFERCLKTGAADMVDVELSRPKGVIEAVRALAHDYRCALIISLHDIERTPARDEIVDAMCQMQDLGADMCKVAVMPHSPGDVVTLLGATWDIRERFADVPLITMAMGETGLISRIAGFQFGSVMTFAIGARPSASGQISAPLLRQAMQALDRAAGKI